MKKIFQRLVEISHSLLHEQSFTGRCFHVSFVLHGNKILSLATNSYLEHHLQHRFGKYQPVKTNNGNYQPGRHSEAQVVRKIENCLVNPDYSRLVLVNIRIDRNHQVSYSAPCYNCFKNIIEPRHFKRVYFSVRPNYFEKLG